MKNGIKSEEDDQHIEECAATILDCARDSINDARHFKESGLCEATGVKEEDIRDKWMAINLAKKIDPSWGNFEDVVDRMLWRKQVMFRINGYKEENRYATRWFLDRWYKKVGTVTVK